MAYPHPAFNWFADGCDWSGKVRPTINVVGATQRVQIYDDGGRVLFEDRRRLTLAQPRRYSRAIAYPRQRPAPRAIAGRHPRPWSRGRRAYCGLYERLTPEARRVLRDRRVTIIR